MKNPFDITNPEPGVYLLPVYNTTPSGAVQSDDDHIGYDIEGNAFPTALPKEIAFFDPSIATRPGIVPESLIEACRLYLHKMVQSEENIAKRGCLQSAENYLKFALTELGLAGK